MQAVVLVGGQGTRLRPLTLTTPKPLAPLCNRPLVEHVVAWLESQGVDEVLLATQYRAAAFERWLRRRRGIPVRAIEEPEPRGTAGAVAHLADELDGTAVIINGDNLMSLDLRAMLATHRAAAAVATISIDRVDDPTGRGVVVRDDSGRVVEFQEKPAPGTARAKTVNTGAYLLEPSAIATIPRDRFCNFEQDVFPALIASDAPVHAFESAHLWIDTGTPAGYLRAQAAVLDGRASSPAGESIRGAWQEDNVTIDGAARLSGGVAIGFGTIVAAGARLTASSIGRECHVLADSEVERSAIWDGCMIERGAIIRDSIIGYNCYIGAGAQIDGAVLGDGTVVAAGARVTTAIA
jgi:mannose-1-phosphate guanylyltransferase